MKVHAILHKLLPQVPEELMTIAVSHAYPDAHERAISMKRDASSSPTKQFDTSIDELLAHNPEITKYAISDRSAMILYTRKLARTSRIECALVYLHGSMYNPGKSRSFTWTRLQRDAAMAVLRNRHWKMRKLNEKDIEQLSVRGAGQTVYTGKLIVSGAKWDPDALFIRSNSIKSSRFIIEVGFSIVKTKSGYSIKIPGVFIAIDDFMKIQTAFRSGNPDPEEVVIHHRFLPNSFLAKYMQLAHIGSPGTPVLYMDILPEEIYSNLAAKLARKILTKGDNPKCDQIF